ncbi:Clan CA, family C19, ubiquitin hydrolase-like cysteine peptidase [Tritrichomonas foetus]|uniref:Ubiquitin carboxyl-terminal hydrolase n=1 Tax=Tritrichomonas foetus TaxID=1144522 RepID=A0A1J4KL83_9EUKA|nr:Clan CA, family C19, ubiquitin hydrolase-like cysteine peptidase [Tritrichomonas foetus]|eukprot:OHT10548.1 Clan CA, family C19, ubiquitin hydrolase-like cysteine peptidase [Tritrichomonas foetus]
MNSPKIGFIHVDLNQKAMLVNELQRIERPTATNRATRVALIEKKWIKALIDYLKSPKMPPPGKIRTIGLFKDNKFNPECKFHHDFEVVDMEIWEKLTSVFGKSPQIVRYFILHPKTKESVVIIKPINMKIIVKFKDGTERSIRKYVAEDWEFGDIKAQLCLAIPLPNDDYSFYLPNSPNPIPNSKNVGQLYSKYQGDIILQKNIITPSKQPIVNSILNKYANYGISRNGLPRPTEFNNKYSINLSSSSSDSESDPDQDSSDEYEVSVSTPPAFHRPISKITAQNPSFKNNQKILKPISKISESPSRNSVSQLSPIKLSTSSLCPKPYGLRNLGNTCFFNAAVQCLVRCQPLTDFMLSSKCESQINRNNPLGAKGRIATAYKELLEEMVNPNRLAIINPSRLHSIIAQKYPIFEDFGQNDSQELIGALLDGLHEDLNQSAAARGHEPAITVSKDADSWDVHCSKNSSPVNSLFYGTLFSTIECPMCHHETSVRDPFVFLSLPIPSSYVYTHVSLSDCISNFTTAKTLDSHNLWKCDKCRREVPARNKLGICKTPDILIIHLKRFNGQSYFMKKTDTPVDYPDILDASTFSKDGHNKKYALTGVVFHHGSLVGGHYTAAAMDPQSGRWYEFNDSLVSPIRRQDAHSSQAYILFYQKC